MSLNIGKKLLNVMTLYYLVGLEKKVPTDAEKIKRVQGKKVHKLMKRAYQIPFYRKRFEENHLTPDDFHSGDDLEKFPILTKAELRQWMKELYDANPGKRDAWDTTSTSGSTGVPLTLYQSQRERAFSNANWIRCLMTFGYKPFTGKMISYESSYRTEKKKHDSIVQKLGILRRYKLSEKRCEGDGTAEVIKEINELNPDLIVLRKNCIVRIALYAQQHGLAIKHPKWYIPVSEMVDEMTVSILEKSFGKGLVDAYGTDETTNCVVKYPGKDHYDILNDTHVVNVYDEHDRLCDNGRMILTTLYKTDFPIINYDIGDTAYSYRKDGVRFITKIYGRSNDMIKHENGDETSVLELRKIPNGITGIAQFRYIQESFHDMRIQLVKDPADNDYTQDEITEYMRKKLTEQFADEFALHFEWLDVIPPDKNGKLRCFVCKV